MGHVASEFLNIIWRVGNGIKVLAESSLNPKSISWIYCITQEYVTDLDEWDLGFPGCLAAYLPHTKNDITHLFQSLYDSPEMMIVSYTLLKNDKWKI